MIRQPAKNGHVEVVEILFKMTNALDDVNAKDRRGGSALMKARAERLPTKQMLVQITLLCAL